MLERVSKILSALAIVIGVIAFWFTYKMADLGDEAMEEAANQAAYLDPMYFGALLILGIAAVSTVLFSVAQMVSDPKKIKGFVISLVAFAAVYFIASGLASDEIVQLAGDKVSTAEESKWSDIGLYSFYIVFAIAVISLVFGPVVRRIRS